MRELVSLDRLKALIDRTLRERGACAHGDELRFPCPNPEHVDEHPSADWNFGKGVWCCRACRAHGGAVDLAKLLGIEIATPPRNTRRDILEAFAHERRIPISVLHRFGVRATTCRGRTAIRYPTPLRIDRLKFVDGEKPKCTWAGRGGSAHWYGLTHALALLAQGGILYIVNGEPSVWACAAQGVAAVCLCAGEGTPPSADLVAQLQARLPAKIRVRVVYDADRAGMSVSTLIDGVPLTLSDGFPVSPSRTL